MIFCALETIARCLGGRQRVKCTVIKEVCIYADAGRQAVLKSRFGWARMVGFERKVCYAYLPEVLS